MKPSIKHFGKIVNGGMVFNDPNLYNAQLKEFEGQEVEVIVRKRIRKTTLDQHAYYRGGILPVCYQQEMFAHYDKPDDIHDDYFADKFLSYKKIITLPNGHKREKTVNVSMSDLSMEETASFIQKVIIECDMLGISILTPEEYYNRHYK